MAEKEMYISVDGCVLVAPMGTRVVCSGERDASYSRAYRLAAYINQGIGVPILVLVTREEEQKISKEIERAKLINDLFAKHRFLREWFYVPENVWLAPLYMNGKPMDPQVRVDYM